MPEQTSLLIPEVGDVNLCHLPYSAVGFEGDKYTKWRPDDNGSWLLCGHVHDKWKTKRKMINVDVDVWDFQPVSVVEIIRTISENSEPVILQK